MPEESLQSEELSRRYRNVIVFGPFQPVRPDDLADVENAIGPLPAPYRAFIEIAYGGALQYAVRIPPRPDGEVMQFDSLHPVSDLLARHRELPKTVFSEAFAAMGIIAGSLLPIAEDGGGSRSRPPRMARPALGGRRRLAACRGSVRRRDPDTPRLNEEGAWRRAVSAGTGPRRAGGGTPCGRPTGRRSR